MIYVPTVSYYLFPFLSDQHPASDEPHLHPRLESIKGFSRKDLECEQLKEGNRISDCLFEFYIELHTLTLIRFEFDGEGEEMDRMCRRMDAYQTALLEAIKALLLLSENLETEDREHLIEHAHYHVNEVIRTNRKFSRFAKRNMLYARGHRQRVFSKMEQLSRYLVAADNAIITEGMKELAFGDSPPLEQILERLDCCFAMPDPAHN